MFHFNLSFVVLDHLKKSKVESESSTLNLNQIFVCIWFLQSVVVRQIVVKCCVSVYDPDTKLQNFVLCKVIVVSFETKMCCEVTK